MEFFIGCKKLLRNVPFWCGAFYGSLALGAAYAYGVLIMQAITPYGYTDEEAGICASVMVLSGFVGGSKILIFIHELYMYKTLSIL